MAEQANTPKMAPEHKASFKDRMAMFKKSAEDESTVAGGFAVCSPEGFQSRQRTLSKASGAAYTRESMKLKGKVHSTAETEETMRVKKQMNRQSTYAYKKDAEASRAKVSGTGVGDIERVKEQTKLASTVQYKKDAEAGYKGKGMAVAATIETERLNEAGRMSSSVAYSKDVDALKGKAPASHLKGGGAPSAAASVAPAVVKATPAPAPAPEPVAAEPEAAEPEAAEPEATEPAAAEPEAAEPVAEPEAAEPVAGPEVAAEATEEAADDAAEAADEPADDGKKWIAQFDYVAADKDEVSFSDGDIIIKVKEVDEGWVSGTVEKTGESGMLPSNYIEPAPEDGAEPAAEPEVAEPAAEPEAAEPVAEPEAAEPVAEPEAAEPVAEPEAAEPVAEPEAAEPVAEPEVETAEEPAAEPAAEASGEEWKAEYDYAAADEDEVSFSENDIFINVETVDEGWVKGTLKESGKSGMLPSNYIVKCE